MSVVRISVAVGVVGIAVASLAVGLSRNDAPKVASAAQSIAQIAEWQSFISPDELKARLGDPLTLVVDVRPSDQYIAGHIPGSINLPGGQWRTPGCRPGEGDSQYIFRNDDATPDIARYETLLGDAGIAPEHRVVVVGDHGGKANGSVPAMILRWLGHADVVFLDGIGTSRWADAGYELATEPTRLDPVTYTAKARVDEIWTLDTVLAHIDDDSVVYLDTRSLDEFNGVDRRNNRFGGRIPGAIRFDYYDLLADDKTTVTPERARAQLAERGITPDHTVVLYCQTSTRVSVTYLALQDLGFKKIAIYDGSWHEYGNRDDTPIEARTAADDAVAGG